MAETSAGTLGKLQWKDGKGKSAAKPVVNAKSEKMGEFMWRDAYQRHLRIVLCTALYEWVSRWPDARPPLPHGRGRGHDRCLVVLGVHERCWPFIRPAAVEKS